ncbi:metallophosphoesterase [Fulvivirgaceae bacterium BMA12]|uniref:Metallophosphoesterase n=1 Tax=Agaribacillus aureus TaxID=3051825 RepID=A0ABT8LFT1_9BACT|nr:metallophosphoesterase [Fulvivirgaceae bacterium BMA12]
MKIDKKDPAIKAQRNTNMIHKSGLITLVFFIAISIKIPAQESKVAVPRITNEKSWTLVILPDPQSYVKFERNQGIFDIMTAWIAENIDPLKIEMVLCTGDLVEQNNILKGDSINGNQSSINQWRAINRSIARLDYRARYILAAGNHDFGYKNIENRHTQYDKYITVDRNPLNEKMLREYYKNQQGMPTLANALFEWVDPAGVPYLFLNLEFAPRDEALSWALQAINQSKYKDHRVVILTHSYMNAKNERIESENYPIDNGNYGQAIWNKLIKPSQNIVMVIAGHIGNPDDPKGHIAFKQDKRADGGTVTQMVFNAQALGGGWHGNGGDGWLRYLEFMPDGLTVKVKTFSPFFFISPSTQHLAWRTSAYDAFEFKLK